MLNLANSARIGSFIAQPSGTVTIATNVITVTQAYNVVSAETGTVGTIENIQIGAQAGTDMAGYLPRVTLRAASGHFIQVTHSSGTINFNAANNFHLSGERSLDLVRTPTGKWSTTEGIQTTSGAVVTTSGTQSLSNKTLESPIVTGTLELSSSPTGFAELEYKTIGAGTKTHTGGTVTIATIGTLPELNTMTVHGVMQGIDASGGTTVHADFFGGYQRPSGGTIGLVGTRVPTVIHNTGASPMALLETDGANSALVRIAAPPGTFSWTAQVFYMRNSTSV